MPRNPLDYAPRDLAICCYTALYRIAILALLEIVFAGFGSCGNAGRRLCTAAAHAKDPPPLKSIKGLPKGRVYLQLTPAGCRRFGVSPALSAPLGKAALDQAIAIAYACAVSESKCHRVTRSEIAPLFGNDTPTDNVAHVISVSDDGNKAPTVLRIYHATSDIQTTLHHVSRLIEECGKRPTLGGWLASRQYGFSLLCPTAAAVAATTRAIEKSGLLTSSIITVSLGPTGDTLNEALREIKR